MKDNLMRLFHGFCNPLKLWECRVYEDNLMPQRTLPRFPEA